MKTISRTESKEIIEGYQCDICGQTFKAGIYTKREAEQHEIRKHAPKRIEWIAGYGDIYYFDTVESFKKHQEGAGMADWRGIGEYRGPGWYYIDCWDAGTDEGTKSKYMTLQEAIDGERMQAQRQIKLCDDAETFLKENP